MNDVERTDSAQVCTYNTWVIGKCRGNTPLDWGSCKKFVTSESECVAQPECHWETVSSEGHKPLVEVHWMAVEKTEGGVLGAYPFIAGDTQVGDETTISFDAGFTQVPLVYGSISGEAKGDLRVTSKDVGNFSMILQGAAADEKASYLVYNGQSAVGTAFKATGSVISYAYETAEFGECEPEDDGSEAGRRTRTVDCKRSDGETAEDYYCVGERPHETEACVMEEFVIMSVDNGRCLGPKAGDTAGEGTVVAARGSKCESDKAKFKLESGASKGFRLVNAATKMCYCQGGTASSKMMFKSDCNSELCDLEKKDESEDGTFVIKPPGRECLGTNRRRNVDRGSSKDIAAFGKGSPTNRHCEQDKARFTFIKAGSLIVNGYAADVEAGAHKKDQPHDFKHGEIAPSHDKATEMKPNKWYKDTTGEMLTDGEKLDGDHPTTHTEHPGVGWLEETNIDFELSEAGPIQTVNVGFLFKRDWQVKKPKKLQIQCSSDGTTFGNAAVFEKDDLDVPETDYKSEDGGRKVMSFQVADICGDDTTHFRLTVTPKGMNSGKNDDKDKKAVLDEVMAFAPYKFE
jgi:hypothetical protein